MKFVTEILIFVFATFLDLTRAVLTEAEQAQKIEIYNRNRSPLDPPLGSHIYLQVTGGRVLMGVLDNNLEGEGDLEWFMTAINGGAQLASKLHTIQNNNNPAVQGYRIFIPIARNFALAAVLVYHPIAAPVGNNNVLVQLYHPDRNLRVARLQPTNGEIPAWLHGTVIPEVEGNTVVEKYNANRKQWDPLPRSHIYLQVKGGRVLKGVLNNNLAGNGPLEWFMTAIKGPTQLAAKLRTIQNNNNPQVQRYRIFIPIETNFALEAVLVPHHIANAVGYYNFLVQVNQPEVTIQAAHLLPTNGQIPAWLHGLISHPI